MREWKRERLIEGESNGQKTEKERERLLYKSPDCYPKLSLRNRPGNQSVKAND